MSYEDIEPPTPEVDRLYKAIVADYNAGKCSQEEALEKLEYQYFFSSIEIKEEMAKDFESYPFYFHGGYLLDEYISICEKSERSSSPKERDIFIQMIDGIIKKVQKSYEEGDYPEFMLSYEESAKLVYRQVEKVRSLCRKNREIKDLYEQYKDEIANIQENHVSKPVQKLSCSVGRIGILEELKNEGQLYYEKGKYIPYKTMPEFIQWCAENGYIDDGDKKDKFKDVLSPEFIYHKIMNNCNPETIKRYFRAAKKTRTK